MTESQKRILIIMAVVDFVMIGALGGIVITTTIRLRALDIQAPTQVALTTSTVPATWTPTLTPTPQPTIPPRPTNTPTPSLTPRPLRPTVTPTPTQTPTPSPTLTPVTLINPNFDLLMPNRVPGWQWYAYINYKPGDELDPENSYAEPILRAADDPRREIDGTTLQIETIRWLKFKAWVHQTISITPGSTISFSVKATAFSSLDRVIVKAGIDPEGGSKCANVTWGGEKYINQDDGIVTLETPRVMVGEKGAVTVCIYAEPNYPHINNAAFFDQAKIKAKQAPPPTPTSPPTPTPSDE